MDSWTEQAARLREMQRDVRKAYENGEIDVVQMTKLRLQIADRQRELALGKPKDVPRPAVFEQPSDSDVRILRRELQAQGASRRMAECERDEARRRVAMAERQRDELVQAAEEIACCCSHAIRARRVAERIRDGYVDLEWRDGLGDMNPMSRKSL